MPQSAVIIPSYNRPDQLERCLNAVVTQDIEDFEIVVVDDGSPTPLETVCKRFGGKVRCLRQDNAGPATARNVGARSTSASFIAFTDDDCQPRPDWLSKLKSAHASQPDRLVGGAVFNALPEDPFASASQALCDYLYDYFDAAHGRMPFFTSNNIAMSRDRFEMIGGFDQTFEWAAAEDRDFGLRWRSCWIDMRVRASKTRPGQGQMSAVPDLERFLSGEKLQSVYGQSLLDAFDPVGKWSALVSTVLVVLLMYSRVCTAADRRLVIAVFLGLLCNAIVFGDLSAPVDRYQARVVWLIPACLVMLSAACLARSRAGCYSATKETNVF